MADKQMYIPNGDTQNDIPPSLDNNYWFKRLENQLNEPANKIE